MSSRHEARLWAVQFLFQRDFNDTAREAALVDFWEERKCRAKLRAFCEELIQGVELNREDIDRRLRKYAEHWSLERMGAVDRNIMRVALFEMLFCPDIPPVVSINEAVDLAKELSGRESGKFVNGILDRARQDVERPSRVATQPKKTK
ncbi:MAG: transcription antitermination factor NusB [Verrucomicrobia bacterium]|nr:MAG: transcription antitermination factor NusB [Verrucomicrobiota bacterium]